MSPQTIKIADQERQTAQVTIANHELSVVLAQTKEEKIQGLSGLASVPLDGMLFTFEPKKQTSFWMLDMKISIDIIWIADGQVVKVDSDVPPEPDTSKQDLKKYQPPVPVDAVLEIAAGRAQELNMVKGSTYNGLR